MIRCMTVDDELMAHKILEQFIKQSNNLTLVCQCRNALEAFSKLEQYNIDLIFLDIEMPLVNGITFLKTLTNPPQIILTTAFQEYALQGYEHNVVDYLLKPFSFERFAKAISKVKLLSDKIETVDIGHLIIKVKGLLLKIAYTDIIYFEASKDYVKIVTAMQEHKAHLTMKHLVETLPNTHFLRIHKSYILSLSKIRMLKLNSVIIENNHLLPVSISYKKNLLEAYRR